MPKINWKTASNLAFWLLAIGLLVYSRFINLGWGLPYPFHPDERNMATAVGQLNWQDKFNPHFFAYGQFPLYLAYIISWLTKLNPTLSLRLVSAVASMLTFFVSLKTIQLFEKKLSLLEKILAAAILIFSPYAIQFSHFGTTESLLMLFYSLIIYYLLKPNVFFLSLLSGLAVATKVSSVIFILLPVIFLLRKPKKLLVFLAASTIIFVLFSPQNFLHWEEFLGSMRYESNVALGRVVVFYTRQFVGAIPVLFQFEKVFPYALGFFQFVLFLFGFIFLPWKDKKINLLRLAFLLYFLPNAFIFAKWTRFMAPVFPVMTALAILFAYRVIPSLAKDLAKRKLRFTRSLLKALLLLFGTGGIIFSGLSYLMIYQKPDTRIQASEWIYKNIPENSYILSETANVVDIPIGVAKSYQVISLNFYELDNNPALQQELQDHISKADYILVPSRRIFANHQKDKYPLLNRYYEDLNSGALGFEKVAKFSAGLNDERAEETWTVFDHPVVRIYKRI